MLGPLAFPGIMLETQILRVHFNTTVLSEALGSEALGLEPSKLLLTRFLGASDTLLHHKELVSAREVLCATGKISSVILLIFSLCRASGPAWLSLSVSRPNHLRLPLCAVSPFPANQTLSQAGGQGL